MIDRSAEEALQVIKERVEDNAWYFSEIAYEAMLDQGIYLEDIERAVRTGELIAWYVDDRSRRCYLLRGFSIQEGNLVVACRIHPKRVEVFLTFWAG